MSPEIVQAPDRTTIFPGQITAPDLATLLSQRIVNALVDTNCHMLGRVVNFYPEKQTADVNVMGVQVIINSPEPNYNLAYPTLVNCPVICMQGGGGALTFPIASGDFCLILFNDRDIDNWFQNGQASVPASARIHDFSDGLVLVGLNPQTNVIDSYLTNGVQLRYKTSNVTLQETTAALVQGDNVVSVEEKIKIAVGVNTLLTALDDLCTALIGATITGGAFSAGTITALTTAKAEIGAILK